MAKVGKGGDSTRKVWSQNLGTQPDLWVVGLPSPSRYLGMTSRTLQKFFRFNRSERWGLLFLISLLFGLYGLGSYFPSRPLPAAPGNKIAENSLNPTRAGGNAANIPLKISRFDPNRTRAADWIEMGLPARTARTIENYLSKGGRFRKKEDLKKIWGVRSTDYERLAPFIQLETSPARKEYQQTWNNQLPKTGSVNPFGSRAEKRPILDLNLSDSAAWESLPGIGPGYARRIIRYRERLGGFISSEQVGETYQFPDSVFQRIRPWLKVDGEGSVRQLDLNAASIDTLGRHPYCGFAKARVIVRYREQHGSFKSVDELLNIQVLDSQWIARIRPYLNIK